MRHRGVEQVIAQHLLTDVVLAQLIQAGQPTPLIDGLQWRSWPQMFESTAGPWGGFGGAAMTEFQVTTAVDPTARLVLVFVGSDLFAYGWTEQSWFWDQYRGSSISTERLANYGLTVLDRPLT